VGPFWISPNDQLDRAAQAAGFSMGDDEDDRKRRMIDMTRARAPLGVGEMWGDPPWVLPAVLVGGVVLAVIIVAFIGWWR
jgi:hypothetical protein